MGQHRITTTLRAASLSLALLAAMQAPAAVIGNTSPGPAILSPQAQGYYQRAMEMLGDGNYAGVIDQIGILETEGCGLPENERSECAYMLAMALYERGDAECVSRLRDFATSNPASPRALTARLAAADYFFFAGQYGPALEAYDEIDFSRVAPARQPEYRYRRALSMVKCGLYSEARTAFESLLATDGYEVPATYYLAYIDYAQGNLEAAYEGFEKTAMLIEGTGLEGETVSRGVYESQGIEPAYYITQIDYAWGRYETVIRNGQSLLKKKPVRELVPEMERVIGLSYFKLDEYSVAKGYLENYVATEGLETASDAVYALGVIEYSEGDYETALERFGTLTDLNNDLAQSAYLYIGQCAVRQGDDTAAAMAFRKASEMNYDPAVGEAALYNYVAARTRGGNIPFSSSIPLLEEFLRRYPSSRYAADAELYLAGAYYSEKNYAGALRCIDRIPNPGREAREARQKIVYELGVSAMNAQMPEEAVHYLRQACDRSAPDAELATQASLWLGDACYAIGHYADARDAYVRYLRNGSGADATLARYDLAYALLQLGDYSQAAREFERTLDASPAPSRAVASDSRVRLADCLYYCGDYRAATRHYTQAIEAGSPDADYAVYRRAVMYGLDGDLDRKVAELTRMVSAYPSSRWVAAAMLEKGRTYAALGKTQQAVKAFEQLRSSHRSSTEARKGMLNLALTYMESGQPQRAEEVYREILTTWPTSEEASLANEDLRRIYANRGELPSYAQFLNSIEGAPRLDASEMETLEFEAAENAYSKDARAVELLENYLRDYPSGRYLAPVLLDLASAAVERGEPDNALPYLSELLERRGDSPQVPEALMLQAQVLEEKGPAYRREALASWKELERRGGADFAADAYGGIMRTTESSRERLAYAERAMQTGGLPAETLEEARLYEADARLADGDAGGAETLRELAANPHSLAGAKAAVTLGEYYLSRKRYDDAMETLTAFTDAGSPHAYWLARGFIALADACHAKGKTFLAKEYLRNLRQNYPGKELDIQDMISSRLNTWK